MSCINKSRVITSRPPLSEKSGVLHYHEKKTRCFLSIPINWEFSHLLAFMYIQYTVYNSICTYTLKIDKPVVKPDQI